MKFNKEIFDKYRPISIKSLSFFEIGKKFYDASGEVTILQKPITCAELYKLKEISAPPQKGFWLRAARSGKNKFACSPEYYSLEDCCVTEHPYNPWLIFENEQDAKNYYSEIDPTIVYERTEWEDFPYESWEKE